MEKGKSKGEKSTLANPDITTFALALANVTTGLVITALTQEVKILKPS